MRCGICGSKNIKKSKVTNYKVAYMSHDLIIPGPLDLLQCQECSNVILSSADIVVIDEECKRLIKTND